LSGTQGTGPGR